MTSVKALFPYRNILGGSWQEKRRLGSKVSTSHVDDIYSAALAAGAIGGKLTGAGGGGYLLLFVPPSDQPRVRERLRHLLHVPFRFEYSGSQIIFFDQETDYFEAEVARRAHGIETFRELSDLESRRER